MKKTHVIIGASAAGLSTLTTLRRLDPEATLMCIADQQVAPYNKCHLVDYCMGLKSRDQLSIVPSALADFPALFVQGRVSSILSDAKMVTLSDGRTIFYDTLCIATGAHAYLPPITGLGQGAGVFTFHTLEDGDALLNFVQQQKPRRAVVIGAGLSGLECADALTALQVATTVIERGPQVLGQQLTTVGALFVQACMQRQGVTFYPECMVQELVYNNGTVQEVICTDGTRLEADLVVIAAGVRPNSQVVQDLGITYNGYIMVDEYQQTMLPTVFAAGDVTLTKEVLTGAQVPSCTWPDAMFQGVIAAHAMAGKPKKHPGTMPVVSSAFFGTKFASCGLVVAPPSGAEVMQVQGADFHHTYVLAGDRLQGFCLVGDTGNQANLRRALMTGQSVTKDQLVGGF